MTGAQPEATGLEQLTAIAEGRLPMAAMAVLMGVTKMVVSDGKAAFWAQPGTQHLNPLGSVHGGFAATLLDSALGCAVHTILPAGAGYTTLELHVNFVRGIRAGDGLLRCEGEVLHRGRRTCTAEGRVYDQGADRLVAHGTATCLVML